jgi:hypothetical protein
VGTTQGTIQKRVCELACPGILCFNSHDMVRVEFIFHISKRGYFLVSILFKVEYGVDIRGLSGYFRFLHILFCDICPKNDLSFEETNPEHMLPQFVESRGMTPSLHILVLLWFKS